MELELIPARRSEVSGPDNIPCSEWLTLLDHVEIAQVSLVTLYPSQFLGWEVHAERDEWHICLDGKMILAQASKGGIPMGGGFTDSVMVPSLVPHGLLNPSDSPVTLLIASSVPHYASEDCWHLNVAEGEVEHLLRLWQDAFGELE